MVLIKEVLEQKREREMLSIRERLPAKIEKLQEVYSKTQVVRKLQAIETAIDKLINDKNTSSKLKSQDKRQYYKDNKETILSQQRKRREHLRNLAMEETKKAKKAKKEEPKRVGLWDQFQDKVKTES